MARFPGVDYLRIDSLFSEQELLVRETARRFVDERVLPLIRDCFRDARFPKELIPEMASLGFLGANLEGYGCAGMSNVEYGLIMQELERGDSGLRSFVSVQGALVMYPDPHLRQRGAEAALAAAIAIRSRDRLLRADRAGLRIEPGGHADARQARRRRLGSLRRKDVDHQRFGGGRGGGMGSRRGRHPRFPGRTRDARIHRVGNPRKVVHAGVGDLQPEAGRLPRAGSAVLPGAKGLKAAAELPDASPLRDRMGRDRCGHGLL